MIQVLDKIQEDYPNVVIEKINVEENIELATAEWIRSIPHFVFYKDWEEIERRTGVMPYEVIASIIIENS